MSFFNFVQQHYGIRFPAYLLSQLSAFLITDIPRGRSNHTGHRIFLHIFAHINAYQRIAGTKHIFSQLLGQMRFTHAGRTEKHKRSDRAVRVFQAYTAAQDGFGKFFYRSILSHNFCLQIFFHTCKLKTFRLSHTLHRNTGHHRYDIGYFFLSNELTVVFETCFPFLFHFIQASGKFFLSIPITGSQFKVLRLYGFSLQNTCVFYQLFLLFNLFGNINVRQMHTRTGFIQSINGFIREVTVGYITLCQLDTCL